MGAHRCQQLLHNLFLYSLKPEFQYERQIAREFFFISTGKINDDDSFFEQRMACFQEFFVFDYRLSEGFSGSTVFETFLYNGQSTYSIEEMNNYEQLRSAKHAVFQVQSTRPDASLHVVDLLSGDRFFVQPLPDFNFAGFDPAQLFEGRIVAFDHKHYFTGAFILHSKEVKYSMKRIILNFLSGGFFCKAKAGVLWQEELAFRQNLIKTITQKKMEIQNAEKKKAIELLKVTRQIAEIPRVLSLNHLVMALANDYDISCYVPESPFYNVLGLIQEFAYRELKCYRYRHIDPVKIYEGEEEQLEGMSAAKNPKKAKR